MLSLFSLQLTKVQVPNPNDESVPMTLTFRFIKESNKLDSVQFYNVLMRRIQSALGQVELGRNYYDLRAAHQRPQHK